MAFLCSQGQNTLCSVPYMVVAFFGDIGYTLSMRNAATFTNHKPGVCYASLDTYNSCVNVCWIDEFVGITSVHLRVSRLASLQLYTSLRGHNQGGSYGTHGKNGR